MAGILAIDPAWTPHHPSGLAAVRRVGERWQLAGVAPSGPSFLKLVGGDPVDWQAPPVAGLPPAEELLAAATELVGEVEVVTVDMPVALVPFESRRKADAVTSSAFGARGCATHSPSPLRPGPLSRILSDGFAAAGYPVATTETVPGKPDRLLEVYPHPAILRLTGASYRVPYKVQNLRRYWPTLARPQRRQRLGEVWREIVVALSRRIDGIALPVPEAEEMVSAPTRMLKGLEDALDALVCAWVGIEYLAGRCASYGDETAAIWVPTDPCLPEC